MTLKSITTALILIVAISSCGQTQTSDNSSKPKVLVDAEKMATALLDNDFKTFADYSYPKLDKAGKEKFIQDLEKSAKLQRELGDKFHKISITNPSKAVECDGELQCVLRQEGTMSFSDGKFFTIVTNLIGISTDGGKTWVFFNASDKNVDEIRKDYPNICDSLPLTIIK